MGREVTARKASPCELGAIVAEKAPEGFLSSGVRGPNWGFKILLLAVVWRRNWKTLREDMGKAGDPQSRLWKQLLRNNRNVRFSQELAPSQSLLIILSF